MIIHKPLMSTTTFNPLRICADVWRNRYLLGQLIKRDVLLRYRGAMFGVLWIFLSPLIMLAIFAFIFGHIFQTRWPQQDAGIPFWLLLYSGLIAFNVFAETIPRAPTSVRSQPNFVKKIISIANLVSLLLKSKKLRSSEKQNQELRSSPPRIRDYGAPNRNNESQKHCFLANYQTAKISQEGNQIDPFWH